MGMFDDVDCNFRLDGIPYRDLEWQTKSPDICAMEKWEIKENGELWHRVEKREFVQDATAPLGHYSKLVESNWIHEKWNGEFEIHTLTDDGMWHEVLFWFRDGVVKDHIVKSRPSGMKRC